MDKQTIRLRFANGRTTTLYVQHELTGVGDMWATTTRMNSDRGYTIYADGKVERQTWRDGECVKSETLKGAKVVEAVA